LSANEYEAFLNSKIHKIASIGAEIDRARVNPLLFQFQIDIVVWAVRKGRAAIFLDTGMGKTFIQLEWARLMGKNTIIIAPLSVARQTVREGKKINLDIRYIREESEIKDDNLLWITNYENIDNFNLSQFGAVVLDESSILKSFSGSTRRKLTELCSTIPYRLACTATPAPNDNIEIGNHAEFLGICTQAEMLAMFFVNANKEHTYLMDDGRAFRRKGSNKAGTEWRIKHHAEKPFYKWLSSWAITMTKPSDLGYEDDGFILPPLKIYTHFVNVDYKPADQLFFTGLKGIQDRAAVRFGTVEDRIGELDGLLNHGNTDQWIIWAGVDKECSAIMRTIPGAVEVKGSDNPDYKAKTFEDFQDGKIKILVTKPRIGGYGMNFQNAHNMIFFGLNDSWEGWYQCIRREWRFGQTQPVNVHVILSSAEVGIYQNIKRKDAMATRLRSGLIAQTKSYEKGELEMIDTKFSEYKEDTIKENDFTAMLGDSCIRLKEIPDNSVDLTVYSPPFADLYTYTDSEHDLGNSRNSNEFFEHYKFIIGDLLRLTKPGRMTCVHVSDIPAMAQKDGYIGVKDFPGDVIREHNKAGWVFVGRAFVQKNPQAQAIRTKAKALLFVQLRKDSSDSRPALVDQILIFKKPGDNAVPVTPVEHGEIDNETWIEWANGIWLGINESDTLQYSTAREGEDEKHICPLQLSTIERCIKLYSNPGETVLTPFMGIGSEAYQALRFGRKAIGVELKQSYFNVAVKNLRKISSKSKLTLFELYSEINK
jgi:DNA modification methylase